ncbi:basic salivary proline-rich protein 2-like [Melospiza georgiana]|uniref:basic salivary proline-rich protein 2-like n=1 Tax=Melospiza georgiana TaxID=44398 RepID=UPI0025AD17F7|nr:basic salivary proline-rich protein 2-like [Melospiza georgiana]
MGVCPHRRSSAGSGRVAAGWEPRQPEEPRQGSSSIPAPAQPPPPPTYPRSAGKLWAAPGSGTGRGPPPCGSEARGLRAGSGAAAAPLRPPGPARLRRCLRRAGERERGRRCPPGSRESAAEPPLVPASRIGEREKKDGKEGGRSGEGGRKRGGSKRSPGRRASPPRQPLLRDSAATRGQPRRPRARRTAEGPGAPGVLLPLSIPPSLPPPVPPRLRCAPSAPPEPEQPRGWSPRQSRARRSPSPTPEQRAPTAERGWAPAGARSPNATCRQARFLRGSAAARPNPACQVSESTPRGPVGCAAGQPQRRLPGSIPH